MSVPQDIQAIRDRLSAATPGPWYWKGNTDIRHVELVSLPSPRWTVMMFQRWGMNGAKPVFRDKEDRGLMQPDLGKVVVYQVCPTCTERSDPRVYRADFFELDHPDANLIAHAPADIAFLLQRIDELERENATLRGEQP